MSVLPVMCLFFIVCLEVCPSFGSLFRWWGIFLWLIVVVVAGVVVAVFLESLVAMSSAALSRLRNLLIVHTGVHVDLLLL